MRFILLVALFGFAAASFPYSNFQQLIQGSQYQQNDPYNEQYDDSSEYSDDADDYQTQQQNQLWQDNDLDDEDGQYGQGGPNCWNSQGGQQYGQSGPNCWNPQGGQQCQPNYQLLQQLEQPNCQLAAKLYKQAKQERDDKNTVVSPVAVQLTLAALQKGAGGNTKAQIKRTQCPRLSQNQCQQAQAALIRSLKGTNNVQKTQKPGQQTNSQQKAKINVANGIIVNQQTQTQRQFMQKVQNCLGCQVKQCSFKTNPQQCRQQINRLVSAKTNQKIKNIIPQAAVTSNTKMIAVSALQFQAKWGQQFRQQQTTKQAPFYPLGQQKPKHCQALQSQGRFNYYEDDQVQVVGIPTQQQEMTLYVIVPKDQDGLTQVEKEQVQNGQQLKQLLDNCDQQKQHVQVQVPKFQIVNKVDAKQTLLQQGVTDAFDTDNAEFPGIGGQQQQQQQKVHLNKLIHQATIKITEQGISSANTGSQSTIQNQQYQGTQQYQYGQYQYSTVNDEYGSQQYQYGQQGDQVNADHAFAFAVKHNPSNQIILVGRVVDACQKPQNQQPQFQGQYDTEDDSDQE